jgi:hypothetical protein
MPRHRLQHHLLAALATFIGHQSAERELTWMRQALPLSANIPSMVARRVRGEPLQYILGKSYCAVAISRADKDTQELSLLVHLTSLHVLLSSFLDQRLNTGPFDFQTEWLLLMRTPCQFWTFVLVPGALHCCCVICGLLGVHMLMA